MTSIELEENEFELSNLTELQPVSKNSLINSASQDIRQYFQPSEMSKQLEKEIDSVLVEPHKEHIEDPHIPQIGSGREKQITFHEGKIYKLFEETYVDKQLIPNEKTDNIEGVITSLKKIVPKEIEKKLQIHHGLKGWLAMEMEYVNPPDASPITKFIRTKVKTIANNWHLDDILKGMGEEIVSRNNEMIRDKSRLTISGIKSVHIKFSKWAPLSGRGFVEAPSFIRKKECLVNVKNNDDKCLGYAICAFRLHQRWLDLEKKKKMIFKNSEKEKLAKKVELEKSDTHNDGLNQATRRFLE